MGVGRSVSGIHSVCSREAGLESQEGVTRNLMEGI